MRFILGVDPGKEGAFVLINEAGQIIDTERMVYDGSTLSATATARTYKRFLDFVHAYEGEHKEASTLTVFIEKGFTKPSDATSEAYIAKLESVMRAVVMRAGNLSDSTIRASEAFQPILGEIDEARRMIPSGGRGRTDGRKGTFSYGKSCGILEVCAAYGIPYVLVAPATWCSAMHKGADTNIKAKDRSKQILGRKWPQYAQKGSPLWPPRCKSVHLGLLDAYMLAMYGLSLEK